MKIVVFRGKIKYQKRRCFSCFLYLLFNKGISMWILFCEAEHYSAYKGNSFAFAVLKDLRFL